MKWYKDWDFIICVFPLPMRRESRFFAVWHSGEERALRRLLQTRHFRCLLKKSIKKQGREGDLVGLMITDEEWFPRLLFKKE